MLKGKDPYIFIRYGGLDLKNQDGYTAKADKKSFHSPPARRGIYAMPMILQEMFLVSSLSSFQPHTFPKELPEGGLHKKYYSALRKKFRKDTGNIWHHLESMVDRNEIIETNGAWIKTSIKAWAKAASKYSIVLRAETLGYFPDGRMSGRLAGFFSKDSFEVFFDEKVS